MQDKQLFEALLNFGEDWQVTKVEYIDSDQSIHLTVEYKRKEGVCIETGEICKIHDFRTERTWQHLPILQYPCYIHCRIPRIKNGLGNIVSLQVPWADERERHSYLFETLIIKTLQATRNQTKTASLLGISFDKVNRVMHVAVARGLDKRTLRDDEVSQIGLDEKSYKGGHRYMTVLIDLKGNRVLDVIRERTTQAAEALLDKVFSNVQLDNIKHAAMDMWDAFATCVKKNAPWHQSYTISSTW
jgi:transposase